MRKQICTKNFLGWIIVPLVIVLSACQPQASDPKPPEIIFGQDVCTRCGMMIGEARFAASVQLSSGEYLKFDDAGEMFAYHTEHPDLQVAHWWVHDYLSEEWIDAESSYFVKSDSLQTPMGTGVVCFATKQNAETFSAENGGTIYNFDEMSTGAN